MTNIKPVVATMRKFTAGKLVKSLKSRNIAYERLSLNDEIIIRHNSKNGNSKYTYSFSKEDARILSKEMQTPDSYYKTAWSDDKVTFKMINNDGSRHINIEKGIKVKRQSLLQRFLSKTKLADLTHIRLVKDVFPRTKTNKSMMRDVYIVQGGVKFTVTSQRMFNVQSLGSQKFSYSTSHQITDDELQSRINAFRVKR